MDMIRSPRPLTPNHRFEFKARGLRDTYHKKATFSKIASTRRTQKTELIPSPIHRIKLRLGGYSIWSASTSRTIYQDRFGPCSVRNASTSRTIYQDRFGAWAPHSLDAAEEKLGRLVKIINGLRRWMTWALFGCIAWVARTIPEKGIFNAWSTKRSLFAKPFHGWV